VPPEIIVIIGTKPPGSGNRSEGDPEERTIKVKLEGDGPISELLREAADVIDGTAD
jgi:hypothetical protein